MYRVINIGDEKVALLAKSSSNVYYKNIFHEDPIGSQTSDDAELSQRLEFSQRMTFVMNKQAEAQEAVNCGNAQSIRDYMQTITEDDYIDWLDRFDFMPLYEALEKAMDVYSANNSSTSKAKKE